MKQKHEQKLVVTSPGSRKLEPADVLLDIGQDIMTNVHLGVIPPIDNSTLLYYCIEKIYYTYIWPQLKGFYPQLKGVITMVYHGYVR